MRRFKDRNTYEPVKREIKLKFKKSKYLWLRDRSKQMGYRSMKKGIEAMIDQRLFDELFLQGSFGKQNERQIKGLLDVMKTEKKQITI